MIIDAHQHFWKLDLPFDYAWLREPQHEPICRDYTPETLLPHLQATSVDRTVFVQTQHNLAESQWVLELAKKFPFLAGVVGWVDLASEHCEQQLLELKQDPLFVGVRHITQGEPDENFIIRPEVVRGLKVLQKHGVPFDLLFYVQHLKHAPTLAEMLPELPMVVDHLSKPRIRTQEIDNWRHDIQAAARYPNMYCKLSGMVTEASWDSWQVNDLEPYVNTVLEAFGPSRCMFGSDWPVCELAGSYEDVVGALRTLISKLSPSEQDQILCQTAVRFYNLKV